MYYDYIDFPKLPEDIVQEIRDCYRENAPSLISINGSKHFKTLHLRMLPGPKELDLSNNIGIPTEFAEELYREGYCCYSIMPVSQKIRDWISRHIPITDVHASIQAFTDGRFFIPHRDLMRDVAYNYVIEAGGSDVRTCFYRPKIEYAHLDTKADVSTFVPYDRIDLVDQVVFDCDRWHEIKVDNIHSVEDLDPASIRLSLTLSVVS